MKIIDTHQHLWNPRQFPYSWTASQPKFNRSFTVQDYEEATRGLEVEVVKSVHVEADIDDEFMLHETLHILSLAESDDNPVAGLVAAARPEYDDFREYIEQIAGKPLVKGVRRILHTVPDEISTTTTFAENLRSLPDYGLSFDICMLARQLPQAIRLIEGCPEVEFILDHCGNPDIRKRDFSDWSDRIRVIAGFQNVVCKISGIVVNADLENWTVEDLRPAVEHCIECFGWDRVMFGSDWPVCTLAASFGQWVEALLALTSSAGEEDLRKLFYENAERTYRLS